MKTNEKSLVDFNAHVKSEIAATIASAKAAGITDSDIDAIIAKNYDENPTVGIGRVVPRIRKQLISQVEFKSATVVKGCIVGGRDKGDRGGPIRYLLLKPDKKHIEISNFGHNAPYKLETEYPIPVPSLITVRVTPNVEYNSWDLTCIEEITRGPLDKDTLVSVMSASEIPIKTITKDFTFSKELGRAAQPFVIYGKISAIHNEVKFAERTERSSKAVVEKTYNVWELTEDGYKPCFSFGIRYGGGKFIRCHIEHQKHGRPTLMVEDLNELCERAVQKHPDSPEDQAKYLYDWIGDIDVLVAGVVTSYREGFDSQNKPTTNIEIGVAAMTEVRERVPGNVGQTTHASTPPVAAPASKPAPAPAAAAPATAATDPVEDTSVTVRRIMADIKMWCSAANVSPSDVTVDVLKQKAASRYTDIPDGVILEAVDRIKAGE